MDYSTLLTQTDPRIQEIQRQKAMAEMLMKEGNEPIDPNRTAGKYVVPISPWEGLAKMGKSAAGAYASYLSEQKSKELNDSLGKSYANVMNAKPLPWSKDQSQTGAMAQAAAIESATNPLMGAVAAELRGKQAETADKAFEPMTPAQKADLSLKRQALAEGKFQPIKDIYGNVTGIFDAHSGKVVPTANNQMPTPSADGAPSKDPQEAAMQILGETGSPFVPISSRQDITGRNAQSKAYKDAALGATSAIQQLDLLNSETGKYTSGKGMGGIYSGQAYIGQGGDGATARAKADKASKALANAFMQQNVGAKGSGIRMVEFDAGAVPNADMSDEARTDLINVNKAIANSQIQRAEISNLYPRMHLSNVNAIMDVYEKKNPPVLPTGKPNKNWMPYKDWLAAGRPDNSADGGGGSKAAPVVLQGATGEIPEGSTATGKDGHKITFKGGTWVDAQTGAPVQ